MFFVFNCNSNLLLLLLLLHLLLLLLILLLFLLLLLLLILLLLLLLLLCVSMKPSLLNPSSLRCFPTDKSLSIFFTPFSCPSFFIAFISSWSCPHPIHPVVVFLPEPASLLNARTPTRTRTRTRTHATCRQKSSLEKCSEKNIQLPSVRHSRQMIPLVFLIKQISKNKTTSTLLSPSSSSTLKFHRLVLLPSIRGGVAGVGEPSRTSW